MLDRDGLRLDYGDYLILDPQGAAPGVQELVGRVMTGAATGLWIADLVTGERVPQDAAVRFVWRSREAIVELFRREFARRLFDDRVLESVCVELQVAEGPTILSQLMAWGWEGLRLPLELERARKWLPVLPVLTELFDWVFGDFEGFKGHFAAVRETTTVNLEVRTILYVDLFAQTPFRAADRLRS